VSASRWSAVRRPWRALALAVLAPAIAVAVVAAPRVGLSWDEEHSAQNGEYAAAWYRTFGGDDRVVTAFNQRFYGSAFNLASHLAAAVSPLGPYETNHLLIALLACAGGWFVFRLGQLLGGDRAGFFALVVLVLTPPWVGHAFMNPKDVPLAALFVAGAYYVARAATELPAPRPATLVGLAVATGLAAGVRVIGIFLVGYWGIVLATWWLVATLRRRPRPGLVTVAAWWALPALAAWTIMVACWPYAQLDPIRNPVRAFLDNAAFQFRGALLFEGVNVSPQSLSTTYLPTWFAISLPEL
jgi:4-amino-4-deoxy-L-arabinose transferase-like glycosyltransferase